MLVYDDLGYFFTIKKKNLMISKLFIKKMYFKVILMSIKL